MPSNNNNPVMPESVRTVNIPIFGFRSRQKSVAVTEMETLADLRKSIQKWSLEDVQRLVVGDNPTNDESMISGFSFHNSDGSRISSSEEYEIKAVSFRDSSNSKLHIKARRSSQTMTGLLWVFSLAVLGWTPPVWFSVRKVKQKFTYSGSTRKQQIKSLLVAIIFVSIFLLDFADALVDLLIVFQDLIEGTEGNRTYGIILGVMTILARLLAGWYGVSHKKISSSDFYDGEVEKLLVATYFFVELSVFMMEDGAAILYLANTHREDDLLTQINTILTSICGVSFVCYNVFSVRTFLDSLTISVRKFQVFSGHTERRIGVADNAKCKSVLVVLLSLSSFGFAVAMVVLLIQQVWMKDFEGDIPFSEDDTAKTRWTIVYGVGVALSSTLAASLVRSFKLFEEITLARRSELDEYRQAFNDPHAKKIPRKVKMTLTTTTSSAATITQTDWM